MLVGALVQLGFSMVLGILFALFVSRGTSTIVALFAGIAVGIAIWAAMDLFVLPFTNPTMAARIALMPLAYFIAHLLYVRSRDDPAFIGHSLKSVSTTWGTRGGDSATGSTGFFCGSRDIRSPDRGAVRRLILPRWDDRARTQRR